MADRTAQGSSPFDIFFAHLDAAHILTNLQLAEIAAKAKKSSRSPKPNEVAGWLVREQWLSRWQAETLLAGGGHSLRLGKYILLDKLGAGGMGAVYKALEVGGMGRTVAVKTMADHLLDKPQSVGRFRREIQAAAALSHPNIIRIYDAESLGRKHFLVMEYVEGCDLESVLEKQGPLPVPVACDFVRQASLGLQHAHEKGMIHRDIKPQNLFVCHGPDNLPQVKILDMGLAKFARDGDAALTGTGQLLGTPDYMAPEQVDDFKHIDIRADIYSLGCTLFKLLTGRAPFTAAGENPMRRMLARLAQEAPPIRSHRGDVPLPLEAVIARMLARTVADRFQTPQVVADALAPFTNLDSAELTAATSLNDVTLKSDSLTRTHEIQQAILEQSRGTIQSESAAELEIEARIDSDLDQFYRQLAVQAEQRPVSAERQAPKTSNPVALDGTPATMTNARWRKHVGTVLLATFALTAIGSTAWFQLGSTTLVIDIPAGDREGVELFVDGKKVWVREAGPIEVPGSWGERKIKIIRPKHHDIVEAVTLGYGKRKTYMPRWKYRQPPGLTAPFSPKSAKEGQEGWAKYLEKPPKFINSNGMEFMLIPPGEFMMGTSEDEAESLITIDSNTADWRPMVASESPRHRVRITIPFYMQTTEVTLGQFRQFVDATGYRTEGEIDGKGGFGLKSGEREPRQRAEFIWNNPRFTPTDDHPVVFVSWNDAVAFANWLHSVDGKDYRLPTEAQWEYCCRAGTETWWYSGSSEVGLGDYAWYFATSVGGTHPTGRKQPNAFGLFDLHGNVMEWTADGAKTHYLSTAPVDDPVGPSESSNRILRGGYYSGEAVNVRSGRRFWNEPTYRHQYYGFRLSMTYD